MAKTIPLGRVTQTPTVVSRKVTVHEYSLGSFFASRAHGLNAANCFEMQQMPQQVQQQVQGIAENLERSQRRWAQHAAGHSLVIQEWGGGVRLRERVDQCVAHYLWTLEPKYIKKWRF